MSSIFLIFDSAARVCAVEMLEKRQLMSIAFGSNLVLNAGAETWSGVATGYTVITPTDWSASGTPTVAQYNRFFGPEVDIAEPDGSGKAFFTGGPDSSPTQFYQNISLSSLSTQISAGQINFDMSAALGGFSDYNDNAQLYVIFKNTAGVEISSALTGTVLASDRNNATKLLYRTQTGTIPAGTSTAEVLLQFNPVDVKSSYNYAFADDVRFVVYTNTPSTAGIAPAVAKSTLPTTGISGLHVSGGIDLTLTNNSTSKNVGPGTVSLFASTDGTVDSSSILLDKLKHTFAFGANQIEQLDVPLKTLNVSAGTYTIFAQTADQYGTVDTTPTRITISVEPQTISLSASLTGVSPLTVSAGGKTSFTLTLENSGNIDSTGLASIAIGLSSNGSTLDVPLTTLTRRITVAPGNHAVKLRLKVQVPVGLTGAFYPFVTFTQGANSVRAIGMALLTITG